MISFVNAKINLGLNVVRRREDGYHDLNTVFYPIGINSGAADNRGRLCDVIEIVPSCASSDSLRLEGIEIDCRPDENLVWKALQLFRRELTERALTQPAPLELTLEKHLPFGAGMGAGSADASVCLLMLNELTGRPFSTNELTEMASRLGADCPFFILNRPAYAEGTGERLTPIDLSLAGKWLVVLKDEISISTRQAFAGIVPSQPEISPRDAVKYPIREWRRLLVNDFEKSAFSLYPHLSEIKDYLYEAGASYAAMSGSGSALFGIFEQETTAREALKHATTCFREITRLY